MENPLAKRPRNQFPIGIPSRGGRLANLKRPAGADLPRAFHPGRETEGLKTRTTIIPLASGGSGTILPAVTDPYGTQRFARQLSRAARRSQGDVKPPGLAGRFPHAAGNLERGDAPAAVYPSPAGLYCRGPDRKSTRLNSSH